MMMIIMIIKNLNYENDPDDYHEHQDFSHKFTMII